MSHKPVAPIDPYDTAYDLAFDGTITHVESGVMLGRLRATQDQIAWVITKRLMNKVQTNASIPKEESAGRKTKKPRAATRPDTDGEAAAS